MDRPPPIPLETVRAFVVAAHGDLDTVTAMLAESPLLANACWDWGAGDYETALGAAAHTGGRAIAELLLAHGARLDIFAAAMLGRLDVVLAILSAFPDQRHARGAHGIPLARHAELGGEAAAGVVAYLASLPAD